MKEMNEIKLPKGVESISVTQHDDRIVIEFIPEKPKFKRGDILISTVTPDLTVIFDKTTYTAAFDSIYNNMGGSNHDWYLGAFRHATKEEKQEFFDKLKADGKRWNDNKKCIEDIPKRKFKTGDKVKIKDGISSETHRHGMPTFTELMDEFIGKELTVKKYSSKGFVVISGDYFDYHFNEDWLEPLSDEPKNGDLAIFWDNGYSYFLIRPYGTKADDGRGHYDNIGSAWDNAVKWDGTKEQFEKVLRGEI